MFRVCYFHSTNVEMSMEIYFDHSSNWSRYHQYVYLKIFHLCRNWYSKMSSSSAKKNETLYRCAKSITHDCLVSSITHNTCTRSPPSHAPNVW